MTDQMDEQQLKLANEYYRRKQLDEALSICNALLAKDENCINAIILASKIKIDKGDIGSAILLTQKLMIVHAYEAALKNYERLSQLTNNRTDVLLVYAEALYRLNRIEDVLDVYAKVIVNNPGSVVALNNRGVIFNELKRFGEALVEFQKVLTVDHHNLEAITNIAITLAGLQRYEEALSYFNKGLQLQPHQVELMSGCGNMLMELKRYDEALELYTNALAFCTDPLILNNRGEAFRHLNRYEESLNDFNQALNLATDAHRALILNNKGISLSALGFHEEALNAHQQALLIDPSPLIIFNEALCLLLLGNLKEGFKKFESRWESVMSKDNLNVESPLWLGSEEIKGKRILIYAEQGFGDTIQCVRYIEQLAERGATVYFEGQIELYDLLKTIPSITKFVVKGEPYPDVDFHCPLLSLPLVFGTVLETIPAKIPYLYADKDKSEYWKQKLITDKKMKIGVAWTGNAKNPTNVMRRIPFNLLSPLFESKLATFVSLQKDITEDEHIILDQYAVWCVKNEIANFSDTAALINNLDLVISADTSVAHLAGALGKPVWIMLPFTPDWRWLLARTGSPWYPTATLFRQEKIGDWSAVINAIITALKNK